MAENRNRITIAILALGGQGGGVLTDWIQEVGRQEGWLAQGTSIAGVAQRTGSTVYYVELAKPDAQGRLPVMAQMPMPGDVDIVLASELMETGRALLRGFSTPDRTVLIGSTHRIYAIGEKMAMGDGRGNGDKIIAAAQERARKFIGFDMEAATDRSGSVISSIMFGALAGSGALPFPTETFRTVIEMSGIAVQSNFRGFAEGFEAAQRPVAKPEEIVHAVPVPTSAQGKRLAARVEAELPEPVHANALHGVVRLMDYQDAAYADAYLDRLARMVARDAAPYELTAETARHLALWMSYEDTARVADLKTRGSRVDRVRSEVKAQQDQVLSVTEFMHPRMQEVCEMLPAGLGRRLLGSGVAKAVLGRFFTSGRHVETTSLRWYLTLRLVASMGALRRRSLRFVEEQERIEDWLGLALDAAAGDRALALELVRCQRLIKGYGDTFERGLRNYEAIVKLHKAQPRSAEQIRHLRELALSDETCAALDTAIAAAG